MNRYISTGFPRGRPRIGEIRPPSVNAIKCYNYRTKRLKRDSSYRKILAKLQADWRIRNLERSREISRNQRRRKRLWNEFREGLEDL